MRTDKNRYFLDLALRAAQQGTCLRRNFGAIIVEPAGNLEITIGYTGSPIGTPNCCDKGWCLRNKLNIPSGQSYEKCFSVHAEMNALLKAGAKAYGCVIYVIGFDVVTKELVEGKPCFLCTKMLINAGIQDVITLSKDRQRVYALSTRNLFENYSLELEKEMLDTKK